MMGWLIFIIEAQAEVEITLDRSLLPLLMPSTGFTAQTQQNNNMNPKYILEPCAMQCQFSLAKSDHNIEPYCSRINKLTSSVDAIAISEI